jgi:hypothetical protein
MLPTVWEYLNDQGSGPVGPFSSTQMNGWFLSGWLLPDRQVREVNSDGGYVPLGSIVPQLALTSLSSLGGLMPVEEEPRPTIMWEYLCDQGVAQGPFTVSQCF